MIGTKSTDESTKMMHQRNASHHDTSTSNFSVAHPCVKCQTYSSLFSRSRSENQYELICTDCGLSKKEKAMKKWNSVAIRIKVVAILSTVSAEDVNEESDCSQPDDPIILNVPTDDIDSTAHSDQYRNLTNEIKVVAILSTVSAEDVNEELDSSQPDDPIILNVSTDDIDSTAHSDQYRNLTNEKRLTIEKRLTNVKLLLRFINALLEASQASFAQVSGQHKLMNRVYWKVIFIICSICLAISIGEFIVDVVESKAKLQVKGYIWWLYYPEPNGRLYGDVFTYIGVVSSSIQFILNLTTFLQGKKTVNFETLPLLFSISQLAIVNKVLVVKCRLHSCVFQCPRCVCYLRDVSA